MNSKERTFYNMFPLYNFFIYAAFSVSPRAGGDY